MSATRAPVRRPATAPRPTLVGTRPRRRRLRTLGVLLLVVALAVAAWVLGWSDLLGVRTVEVHGEHRASERLVDLTADVEQGTPLARVDTDAIEERLRELRVVADAHVERVWPHTLRITVVERTGVAVVRKGDSLHLVDSTGVDFAQVPGRVDGLPFIDVDLTATDPAVVTTALAVVDGLPSAIGRRVMSLEAHSIDDVRLRLRSGAVVLWGDASEGEQKAEVLRALLRQRADRYDVRAPMAPTTTG